MSTCWRSSAVARGAGFKRGHGLRSGELRQRSAWTIGHMVGIFSAAPGDALHRGFLHADPASAARRTPLEKTARRTAGARLRWHKACRGHDRDFQVAGADRGGAARLRNGRLARSGASESARQRSRACLSRAPATRNGGGLPGLTKRIRGSLSPTQMEGSSAPDTVAARACRIAGTAGLKGVGLDTYCTTRTARCS